MLTLTPLGRVHSPLADPSAAPKQGNEGAPEAWIDFDPAYADGLRDLRAGDEVLLLTWLDRADRSLLLVHPRDEWLDRADRSLLLVHPRDDASAPLRGVFSTRSADRPNPIGIHRVTILAVETPLRFRVRDLEAVDGTPIVDVKPVIDHARER